MYVYTGIYVNTWYIQDIYVCVYMHTYVNMWVYLCMCVWICTYIVTGRFRPDPTDRFGHSPTHLSPFVTKVTSLYFSRSHLKINPNQVKLRLWSHLEEPPLWLRHHSTQSYVHCLHFHFAFNCWLLPVSVLFYNCVKYSFGFKIKYTKRVLLYLFYW